ncbi:signal recognition particle protein Srp54 [Candidatus Woesearchaeota archaeon]|nr:signal recognition particle protein Srp54 [Candidatus Woesearchaeota archaeon]
MVLEKLGDSLKETLKKIAKSVFVDEKLINELVKDIQRALLQADVNVKLVFELTQAIKSRALKEETPSGLTKKEQLVNIVYEELVKFLGEKPAEIKIEKKPFKIMMIGLFGSGKTTTIGKLAKYFTKKGHKVAAVGLDVHRPAAPEQLAQVCKQINVPCFIEKTEKDPVKIYKKYEPDLNKFDVVLIDTAGRDALSDDLIKEIRDIYNLIKPDENLLVISADIGQAAQKQAQVFHDNAKITGVVATKMDGTAKGGGALTACAATDSQIKFIGVGEKVDDLETFNPPGFVGRLLGMGDIQALLEKAKEAIPEEKAEDLSKRLLKGEFTLMDLFDQMEAMKKMGSLGKIMEMIPGLSQIKLPKDVLNVQEGKLKKWKHAMLSMTKEELEDPTILNASRIDRISKGSGVSAKDIRELIKQYRTGKKMVKMLKGKSPKNMQQMMKKFQGKMPPGMGM